MSSVVVLMELRFGQGFGEGQAASAPVSSGRGNNKLTALLVPLVC